jgi:hypothetical protein
LDINRALGFFDLELNVVYSSADVKETVHLCAGILSIFGRFFRVVVFGGFGLERGVTGSAAGIGFVGVDATNAIGVGDAIGDAIGVGVAIGVAAGDAIGVAIGVAICEAIGIEAAGVAIGIEAIGVAIGIEAIGVAICVVAIGIEATGFAIDEAIGCAGPGNVCMICSAAFSVSFKQTRKCSTA